MAGLAGGKVCSIAHGWERFTAEGFTLVKVKGLHNTWSRVLSDPETFPRMRLIRNMVSRLLWRLADPSRDSGISGSGTSPGALPVVPIHARIANTSDAQLF